MQERCVSNNGFAFSEESVKGGVDLQSFRAFLGYLGPCAFQESCCELYVLSISENIHSN